MTYALLVKVAGSTLRIGLPFASEEEAAAEMGTLRDAVESWRDAEFEIEPAGDED